MLTSYPMSPSPSRWLQDPSASTTPDTHSPTSSNPATVAGSSSTPTGTVGFKLNRPGKSGDFLV